MSSLISFSHTRIQNDFENRTHWGSFNLPQRGLTLESEQLQRTLSFIEWIHHFHTIKGNQSPALRLVTGYTFNIQITVMFTFNVLQHSLHIKKASNINVKNFEVFFFVLFFKCCVYLIFCTKTMNDGNIYRSLTETKQYLKLNKKQKKSSHCDVAPLCYTSSSVDLSKLLLVAKVSRLPLDCVASLPHNSQPYPWKYSFKRQNNSNAKHAFKLSVYRTNVFSLLSKASVCTE